MPAREHFLSVSYDQIEDAVLQCKSCKSIVGDTRSFVCTVEVWNSEKNTAKRGLFLRSTHHCWVDHHLRSVVQH